MLISNISLHKEVSHCQALPPKVQEAKERDAIRNDERLMALIGDQEILEIQKVKGGYVVVTDAYTLPVDVIYLPSERHICGPARFELLFHLPVPR